MLAKIINPSKITSALIIKLISALLTFLMFFLVARYLSVEKFGVFGIAFSLATFFSVVCDFGFSTLVVRLFPEHSRNGIDLTSVVVTLVIKVICAFIVGSTILLGLALFLLENFTREHPHVISLSLSVVCLLVALCFSEIFASILRAKHYLKLALVPKDIIWRFFTIFIVLGLGYFEVDWPVETLLLIMSLGLLSLTLTQLCIATIYHGINFTFIRESSEYDRDWLEMAKPIWLSTLIFASAAHLDVVLVGLILSTEAAASYFACLKIASIFALPLTAMNQVSGPIMAENFYSKKLGLMQKNLYQFVIISLVLTLPLIIIVVVYGETILNYISPEYAKSYWLLLLLSSGYIIHCATGPTALLLQITGFSRPSLVSSAITQSIAFIFIFLLGPYYGAIGIAFIRSMEIFLRKIWQSILGWQHVGVHAGASGLLFYKHSRSKNIS